MKPSKAAQPSKPTEPVEDRYEFSPAEADLVNAYLALIMSLEAEIARKKENIGVFLGFVEASNQLTARNGQAWVLRVGPDGKPFMKAVSQPAK